MTELSIRPEEIRAALQKYVDDYKPSAASISAGMKIGVRVLFHSFQWQLQALVTK